MIYLLNAVTRIENRKMMDSRIGLLVKLKSNLFLESKPSDLIKIGTKGFVYNITNDSVERWYIIFESGEFEEFTDDEKNTYLTVLKTKIKKDVLENIQKEKDINRILKKIHEKKIKFL